MSQSRDLLNATGALTDAVHDALFDAAYSPYQLQLNTAHDALTTEMYLIKKYASDVDAAPADGVQAAIGACGTAENALQSAATPAQRQHAISLTFEAIAAVKAVLPQGARALV